MWRVFKCCRTVRTTQNPQSVHLSPRGEACETIDVFRTQSTTTVVWSSCRHPAANPPPPTAHTQTDTTCCTSLWSLASCFACANLPDLKRFEQCCQSFRVVKETPPSYLFASLAVWRTRHPCNKLVIYFTMATRRNQSSFVVSGKIMLPSSRISWKSYCYFLPPHLLLHKVCKLWKWYFLYTCRINRCLKIKNGNKKRNVLVFMEACSWKY